MGKNCSELRPVYYFKHGQTGDGKTFNHIVPDDAGYVYFYYSSNFVVENITPSYVDHAISGYKSYNITIKNVSPSHISYEGILFYNSRLINITETQINDNCKVCGTDEASISLITFTGNSEGPFFLSNVLVNRSSAYGILVDQGSDSRLIYSGSIIKNVTVDNVDDGGIKVAFTKGMLIKDVKIFNVNWNIGLGIGVGKVCSITPSYNYVNKVKLENLTIINKGGGALPQEGGVVLSCLVNSSLSDIKMYNLTTHGMRFNGYVYYTNISDVLVENQSSQHNDAYALSLSKGQHSSLKDIIVKNCSNGMLIDTNTEYTNFSNITIRNCSFYGIVLNEGGYDTLKNITVRDAYISFHGHGPNYIYEDVFIWDSTRAASPQRVYYFYRNVTGNGSDHGRYVPDDAGWVGFFDSGDFVVENISFNSNPGIGVTMDNSYNITVRNSNITAVGLIYGKNSEDITITNSSLSALYDGSTAIGDPMRGNYGRCCISLFESCQSIFMKNVSSKGKKFNADKGLLEFSSVINASIEDSKLGETSKAALWIKTSSKNITVKDTILYNVSSYMLALARIQDSYNITIFDSKFLSKNSYSNLRGIYVSNTPLVSVYNSTFRNVTAASLYCEYSDFIKFYNNSIKSSDEGKVHADHCNNIVLENSTFDKVKTVVHFYSENASIRNIKATDTKGWAWLFYFTSSKNVTLINVSMSRVGSGTGGGVYLSNILSPDTSLFILSNLSFLSNSSFDYGVQIDSNVENVSIRDMYIRGVGDGWGFSLGNSGTGAYTVKFVDIRNVNVEDVEKLASFFYTQNCTLFNATTKNGDDSAITIFRSNGTKVLNLTILNSSGFYINESYYKLENISLIFNSSKVFWPLGTWVNDSQSVEGYLAKKDGNFRASGLIAQYFYKNYILSTNFFSLNATSNRAFNSSSNITFPILNCSWHHVVYRKDGFPQTFDEIRNTGNEYSPGWEYCDSENKTFSFEVDNYSGYALYEAYDIDPPDVYLVSPPNNSEWNGSFNEVNFTFYVVDDLAENLTCSIYIDGVKRATNESVQNNTNTTFTLGGTYLIGNKSWYVECNDTDNTNQSETWYLNVKTNIKVFIKPPTPSNNSIIKKYMNVVLNYSVEQSTLFSLDFLFNNSLVDNKDGDTALILHLDNNSEIGENDTYVVDSSKYNNNGVIYGASYANGKFGKGVYFNGTTYINISDDPSLDLKENFTILFWVNYTGYANAYPAFISKTRNSVSNYYIGTWSTSDELYFTYYNSGWRDHRSGLNIPRNEWSFIVVEVSPSYVTFYVNNRRSVKSRQAAELLTNDYPLFLGTNGNGRYEKGIIDEVYIFRRLLNESEIYMIMNATNPRHVNHYNNSLVLFLPFENSSLGDNSTHVVDLSWRDNRGVINNTVYHVDGMYGKAMYFDGGYYDFIQMNPDDALNITSQLTIAAWIKGNTTQPKASDGSNSWGRIVSKGNETGSRGYFLMRNGNYGYARFGIGATNGIFYYVDSKTRIDDGKWHFVVGTFNGSHLSIYIDGALEKTYNAGLRTIRTSSLPLRIGSDLKGSVWHPFRGIIDEVRVYNTSLTYDEVMLLYFMTMHSTNQSLNYTNYLRLTTLPQGIYWHRLRGIDQSTSNTTGISIFYVDRYGDEDANPQLISPENGSTVTDANASFRWNVTDDFSSELWCNLTVDNEVVNTTLCQNASICEVNVSVNTSISIHYWNVTCFDEFYNRTSSTWEFFAARMWHIVYGNISGNVLLATNSDVFLQWTWNNGRGNVYAVADNSNIDWSQLYPLGKNRTYDNSTSDFEELDEVLNTTNYPDNINDTYSTDGTHPKTTQTIKCFGRTLTDVPVANSSENATDFVTGILWDASDDTNGEFDSTENEDIVFVAPVNGLQNGSYGEYNYEIRIPDTFDTYKGGSVVELWVELR